MHGRKAWEPMNKEPRNPRPRRPSARSHPSNRRTGAPGPQGLYDPRFEHDACGVGFVVDIKGRKFTSDPRAGHPGPGEPRPPRRLRRRAQHRRRRRHPDADAARLPRGGLRARRGSRCRRPAITAAASSSCRAIRRCGDCRGALRAGRAGRGPAGPRLADRADRQRHARRDGALLRAVHAPGLHPPQPVASPTSSLRAQALRHPQARRERDPHLDDRGRGVLVRREPLEPHHRLQGHAAHRPARPVLPRPHEPAIETALALVHSRFSTNTFPSWDRAHPYRYIAHNGEINTLRGNINWMHAREALLRSELFGDDIKKIRPIIDPNGSDSAMFDNVLELLVLAGRSLPHAMMMMIPEPWTNHEAMNDEKRAFYEYHSCLMEPWDGPASIAFTDGRQIGASSTATACGPRATTSPRTTWSIMASEVGVLDIAAGDIVHKGRLQPGRMFLVDTEQGRIIADEEIKRTIAAEQPYREWLDENLVHLEDLPAAPEVPAARPRHAAAAPARLRLHLRGRAHAARPDGARTASRRSARWATTRRWPCSRTSRSCSTTTSSSSSPRSRTRRSTASARRSSCRPRRARPRGQPARTRSRPTAGDRAQVADPDQRGAGEAPPHGPAGPASRRPADPVPRHPRREGLVEVDGGTAPAWRGG